jgi:hypothetical protein
MVRVIVDDAVIVAALGNGNARRERNRHRWRSPEKSPESLRRNLRRVSGVELRRPEIVHGVGDANGVVPVPERGHDQDWSATSPATLPAT